MTARRLLGAGSVIVGAAGCAACLISASTGIRDVMRTNGGFCASGGPYIVAHQCSGADLRLVLVGILGGLVAVGVLAGGSGALGRSGSAAGLLAWVSLFGLLGWNFITLGVHLPAGQDGTGGWLLPGVVFLLLALGGLVPFLSGLLSDIRTAGRPDPLAARMQPLVRAAFAPSQVFGGSGLASAGGWRQAPMPVPLGAPPGVPGAVPAARRAAAPAARRAATARLALWLVLVVAGGAIGMAASSPLVSLLR